ncbi:MAG: hypothetical protein IKX56_01475 [Muribaculaceae bacterium]|nr:hypothetical protein [Muribaculaceae bacterium]
MDIFDYTDDLEFLKDYYHLQGKSIEWAVIEETSENNPQKNTTKPGLFIEGSRVYVNLLERKIQKPLNNLYGFSRKAYPAERVTAGNKSEYAVLVAKEDQTKQIILPASFILDIYRECWYGEWMEDGIMSI